jgi:type II secretory pathway pseudopilin PulG
MGVFAMKKKKGFTIAEALVYLAIFAIVMTFVVTLNIEGSQLFTSGAASVDIQEDLNRVLLQLQADLQETDPRSVAIGYTKGPGTPAEYPATGVSNPNFNFAQPEVQNTPQITTAIIMLEARHIPNSNNFDPYIWNNGSFPNGGTPTPPTCGSSGYNPGVPCWENWVCYFLNPNPANATPTTTYTLVRVEFPINSTVKAGPYTSPTLTPNPPSSGWEIYARNLTSLETKLTLASNLDQFAITNPVTNSGSPNCANPPCMFTDPYNFDASSSNPSVVEFSGLPQFWINVEGMEHPNIHNNKARNVIQVLTRN